MLFLFFYALEEQAVFRIGGDEEAVSGRYGEGFYSGAVHETAALELLAEEALAVAGEPLHKLLVGEFVMPYKLCNAESLCGAEAADCNFVGKEVLQGIGANIFLALLLNLIVGDGE